MRNTNTNRAQKRASKAVKRRNEQKDKRKKPGNTIDLHAMFGFKKVYGFTVPSELGKPDRNRKTNRNRFTVKAKLKRRLKSKK